MKGFDPQPAVVVTVGDVPPEVPRFAELAAAYGGSEPDSPFDACALANGQVARCYLSGGTVYAQVVTPGGGAAWGTWQSVATGQSTWSGVCHIAMGCAPGSNTPYLFYVASDGTSIEQAHWNGSAFVVDGMVVGAFGEIGGLAVDLGGPQMRVFWVEADGALKVVYWTGAAWSGIVSNGGIYLNCTIGAAYGPDNVSHVLLAYYGGSVGKLSGFTYDTGAGWGAESNLLTAGVSTNYQYSYARVLAPIGSSGRWVMTWSEQAPAPIGTLPMVAFTPDVSAIYGTVPWNHGGTHGVRVVRDYAAAPSWWIITPSQVWSVPAYRSDSASGQKITFTQDQVFSIDLDGRATDRPAKALITLLNDGGKLSTAGQAGAYLGLRPWSQVAVSLGYHTGQGAGGQGFSAGDEGCWQTPLWVEAVIFHDEVGLGVPLVTLECTDGWGVLEEIHVRSSYTYTSLTADALARKFWRHVSGDGVNASPASLTGFTPASFTVRGGEPLANHLRRLADLVGVAFVFGTFTTSADGVGWDSVSCKGVDYGKASNGTAWAFGGAAGQPIVQSEVAASTLSSANGAEVAGSASTSISRNYDEIYLTWRDRRARITDKTLNTQALTDTAAATFAGLLDGEQRGGHLVCFGNPGLEIGDIVTVTIATAPLSATTFVVAGLRHQWQRDLSGSSVGPTGRYLTTVFLEGTH